MVKLAATSQSSQLTWFDGLDDGNRRSSEANLLLITSLAMFVPAIQCWRSSRTWQAAQLAFAAMIFFSYHACQPDVAGDTEDVGLASCNPDVLTVLGYLRHIVVHLLFLHMAFLVLGPEDSQLHWMSAKEGRLPTGVPVDVLAACRIVPCVIHAILPILVPSGELLWARLLLSETILLTGCVFFWGRRSNLSEEVLLRRNYWRRLRAYGVAPGAMLIWLLCIECLDNFKVVHATWHILIAAVVVGLHMMPESSALWLTDDSVENPNVAHVLLGSCAFLALPVADISVIFDVAYTGEWRWPTIAMIAQLQPGGYLVAIVALPVCMAGFAVVGLIDACVPERSATASAGAVGWDNVLRAMSPSRRSMNRHMARLQGLIGVLLGTFSTLMVQGTPAWDMLSIFCSVTSLCCMSFAISLWVTSEDPRALAHSIRRNFTLGLVVPVVLFYASLRLLHGIFPIMVVPQSMYALCEYSSLGLLSGWPLVFYWEIQAEMERKVKGSFSWPSTRWRFGEMI